MSKLRRVEFKYYDALKGSRFKQGFFHGWFNDTDGDICAVVEHHDGYVESVVLARENIRFMDCQKQDDPK